MAADGACSHEYELALLKSTRKYSIPPNLLKAISLVESGRYRRSIGKAEAYPWTICVNGRGSFCTDRLAAVTKIQQLKNQDQRNIDVGLMQINLKLYGRHFASVNDMIDPAKNVDFAAGMLKRLYNKTGSWRSAVALYHSRNKKHNIPYTNKVFVALDQIRRGSISAKKPARVMLSSMRGGNGRSGNNPRLPLGKQI
ncbi:MAG: lytic transglycosylase domain-containing protein [Holosporales bacterium]|nr:lytic transglycosylase domain-containing protein [Holosporales bacterium]